MSGLDNLLRRLTPGLEVHVWLQNAWQVLLIGLVCLALKLTAGLFAGMRTMLP